MSLDHNMPSQALNNQPALKKAYLQNTQQEGNMKYAYLTNWIAYLDKSTTLIKFHITDSHQFFSQKPQNKTNWGSSQPPCTFYSYSSPKSVINTSSGINQVYLIMHPYWPFRWRHAFTALLANKEKTERKLPNSFILLNEKTTTPLHQAHQAKASQDSSNTFTPVCCFSDYFSGGTIKLKSLQACQRFEK